MTNYLNERGPGHIRPDTHLGPWGVRRGVETTVEKHKKHAFNSIIQRQGWKHEKETRWATRFLPPEPYPLVGSQPDPKPRWSGAT